MKFSIYLNRLVFVMNRFSRWPSWISDRKKFRLFYLKVALILPTKFQVNWLFDSGEERKKGFQAGRHGAYLRFPIGMIFAIFDVQKKKSKRKVQGVPQSQTAALPIHQEKRKPTNPNKHKSNKRTKSTKVSSLFPKRDNRNAKRTEKGKKKR